MMFGMELPAGMPAAGRRYTVEEYFELERTSLEKHEYRDGQIVAIGEALAMSGGSIYHSLVIMNAGGELRGRLKGTPCRVYDSNLRVRVFRGALYSYPDLTVICGPAVLDADDRTGETAMNPRTVVEVLSPPTEAYDRTTKFDRYRQIESFREYVLVAQHTPRVETFFRRDDGAWTFDVADGIQARVRMRSLDIELPLAEMYAGVEFSPASEGAAGPPRTRRPGSSSSAARRLRSRA